MPLHPAYLLALEYSARFKVIFVLSVIGVAENGLYKRLKERLRRKWSVGQEVNGGVE